MKGEPKLPVSPLVVLSFLILLGSAATSPAAELLAQRIRIGFTRECFSGINRNDAEASFKGMLAAVGRRRGYDIASTVEIFEQASTFDQAIEERRLDLVIIGSWHFVAHSHPQTLEPVYVPVPKDQPGRIYALLTRRGQGLDHVADLRGKELLRLEMGAATMGYPWLDTLLLTQGFGPQAQFFASDTVATKPSAAVLPVFFGKKHACLVDLNSFAVLTELNPQVGAALQPVATSERLVDNVVCMARDGWANPEFRADTHRSLGELAQEPAGQQILTLFKIQDLAPFEPRFLENIRALYTAQERLARSSSQPPAP